MAHIAQGYLQPKWWTHVRWLLNPCSVQVNSPRMENMRVPPWVCSQWKRDSKQNLDFRRPFFSLNETD
ncbi:hypothetical protein QQF64_035193 [Cirrhinus molitorella]|uniref:Uncharacterized protein n=1 Tax=Cirrhinus molitorella TaxID=172907 RepID=A0ABR3NF35_9TELE